MPVQRTPLTQPIETRDGTLTKDSKNVNGYFESRDQKREFIKRPGLATVNLSSPLPTAEGQGIYFYNGYIYSVVNNTVYKTDPNTNVTTSVGSITGTIKQCYFTPTFLGTYLFFHNQTNGYLINGSTGAFSQITNDKVASVTILTGGTGYASTDTVVFSAPPSGTTATGTLQLTGGVVTGITITNPGTGYVTAPTVSITTSTGSSFSGTTLLSYFPTTGLVSGVAFLDGYVFVGLPNGRIYSCAVGDPTIWNPLDYITAEAESDNSLAVCKHLNYIMNFGAWSLEFFYDNANPVASPLAAATSYKAEVGCANGDSVVQFEQTVAWIGTSLASGTGIFLLDGTAPTRISTPYIDRILGNSNFSKVTAYAFKMNGHMFYVCSLHDLNITIVYDFNEKMWYQWTMWAIDPVTSIYGEQYFRPSYFTKVNNLYYLLDDDNGTMYTLSDTNYTDAGAPIYYRVITDIVDNGTTKRKFYQRLEIIGDKIPATMKIRHTGDDYKTWSSYRSVDLSKPRAQIYLGGADRRRAWEFLCTDPQPLRLDAAEIDFKIGEIENEGLQPTQYRKS